MNTAKHVALGAVVGAAAAVLPDLALFCFGWRKDWLPETHVLVRLHRQLHRPATIAAVAIVAGWASHVVADVFSEHNTAPETVPVPAWAGAVQMRPLSVKELQRWRRHTDRHPVFNVYVPPAEGRQ